MKNVIKYSAYVFLFTLSACWTPHIDEKYAANVVRDKLSLSGNLSAKKLSGGFSGTMNFLVAHGQQKYVVRLFANNHRHDSEIYNFDVASDEEYGPHIYFSDPSRGIVIMEYLSGKKVTYQDLQSEQFYVALAHLLQKIHQGKAFKGRQTDVFKRIGREIQSNKKKFGNDVPFAKIEHMATIIHQVLLPHLTNTSPCHNDLHAGNLIFMENEFKAIDYGDASQGDPYIDVAFIARTVDPFCVPAHENVLLSTYLGRQPSEVENAKLFLMKQIVSIRWFTTELKKLSPEIVHQFGLIKAPPFREIERKNFEGKIDMSKPENELKKIKAWLNQIFDNFESQEFSDAVSLLNRHDALDNSDPTVTRKKGS